MGEKQTIDEKIYCFWTDSNPLTENRLVGLGSMRKNLGVPIEFLTASDIHRRILSIAPLHPAYRYLSAVHKSDVLRCYFMHHFGGGYADIKPYGKANNWKQAFDLINSDDAIDVVGVPEIVGGAAYPEWNTSKILDKLIACCYFICRPRTKFTTLWYNEVLAKLDMYLPSLKEHPATSPYGGNGYPIPWTALMGKVFHKVVKNISEEKSISISRTLISGRDFTKGWR